MRQTTMAYTRVTMSQRTIFNLLQTSVDFKDNLKSVIYSFLGHSPLKPSRLYFIFYVTELNVNSMRV